jgi:quercetin dioxygenase-like cupin family protein
MPMRIARLTPVLAAGALALGLVTIAAADPPIALHHADAQVQWGDCPDFMPQGCKIAVVRGDPAQPNADVLFRVPGGAVIPRHWHSSAERMTLLSGEMEIDFDGHPGQTLLTGSYGFAPAKLPHSVRCRSSEPCVLFIAFGDPVDTHAGAPD